MRKKKTSAHRTPWTKEDVRELKAHSKARTPLPEIAKKMKRTERALRRKAGDSRHWFSAITAELCFRGSHVAKYSRLIAGRGGRPITHVDVIVPGGGLSPDGSRWNRLQAQLLPARARALALFRRLFLEGLAALNSSAASPSSAISRPLPTSAPSTPRSRRCAGLYDLAADGAGRSDDDDFHDFAFRCACAVRGPRGFDGGQIWDGPAHPAHLASRQGPADPVGVASALDRTVTLRCREREASASRELSGLCDRVPPRGHRRAAKLRWPSVRMSS